MVNSLEQTVSHPFQGKEINEGLRIFLLIVGVIVLIAGVFGNGLLLVAQFQRRRERQFHNIFIANLAGADLVVICTGVPFYLVDLVQGHNPVVSHLHCSLNGFVLSVGYAASILTLVVVSFHRYMKVCHRFLFDKLFSTTRNRAICLALWLIAAVLNSPLLGLVPGYGYDSGSRLCNARGGRLYPCYGSVAMIFMLLVPVLLIGYFNVAIFRIWYGSRRKLQSARRQEKGVVRRQKSFASEPGDNKIDSDNGMDMVNDTDIPTQTTTQSACSDSFHGLSSSSTLEASSEWSSELRNTVRPVGQEQDTAINARLEVSRKSEVEGAADSGKSTVTTLNISTHAEKVAHPKAASLSVDSLNVCHNLEAASRKQQSKTKQVSFLCEELDLKTVVPAGDILKCPGLADLTETSHTQDDEGTSASTSAAAEIRKCYTLPKSATNSKTIKPDTPVVGKARKQRKKSVCPRVDTPRRKSGRYKKPSASELALVRSLLVISICLFVLYTPFVITLILTFIIQNHLPAEVSATSTLLLLINCAINWAVYGVMNTAFRQAYVTTVRNFWRCCQRMSSLGCLTRVVNSSNASAQ